MINLYSTEHCCRNLNLNMDLCYKEFYGSEKSPENFGHSQQRENLCSVTYLLYFSMKHTAIKIHPLGSAAIA